MKQLTILSAILFSGCLLAQSEYCGVGTVWDAESQTCIAVENVELLDSNLDGVVGVEDLLNLLSHFGDEDMDFDGIYDSVDDCVGAYDECGICNGQGIPEGYCTCNLMIDALGECGGNCANDADGDGVCDDYYGPCFGPETIIFDGYTYDLVAIGDQCWFAENLRAEHYANGDAIPANLSDDEWSYTTSGAVAVFGEGDTQCMNIYYSGPACDPEWSLNEYGRLYNWYAVDDERGLCPTGWHVPTDEEWTVMTDFLGGPLVAGSEMKTTYGWCCGGNGTNSSGFSGLPGGERRSVNFRAAEVEGFWWSSSLHETSYGSGLYAFYRTIDQDYPYVYREDDGWLRSGYSVRCLKD